MFSDKTLTVIKRELKDKLFSKTFIIMTLLIPAFMFGILGFQMLMMSVEGDSDTQLVIASNEQTVIDRLETELAEADFIKDKKYSIEYKTLSSEDVEPFVDEYKDDLLGEGLTGIIYIPAAALTGKKDVQYYSKNPNNQSIFEKVRGPINTALLDLYFTGKGLSPDDLSYARNRVNITGFRVKAAEGYEEEGYGNMILAFLFTFLLYFSLIMLGTMVMRAVNEEKQNRIVEVLLSSVKPSELMTGKILGNSIVGTLQMAIWLAPVFLVISTSWFMLPEGLIFSISVGQLVYIVFNFFIGLVTFMGLFGAVGAMFDNDQDAQQGMWPVMLLIMIPFFISFSMSNNPENSIATIASMFPFASIIVMPARMALIDVPFWEIAVSVAVNITTLVVIFIATGKIYRVAILRTGKKPKWSEVVKWLRYDY